MGVFDQYAVDKGIWTFFDVALKFNGRVMGGTPNNPDIIRGWLAAKAGITDEQEIQHLTAETLAQLGYPVRPDMSVDEVREAMAVIEERSHTNSFKRDEQGLYLEDRVVKAMLREQVNILFAGERWGRTKKGPRSFFVERVFVSPARVHLGRMVADGTQLFIGHTDGPSGRQSNLTRYEYAESPVIEFSLAVLKDEIGEEAWPEIWLLGERNGLGSLRSQSFGQFETIKWDKQKATLERVQDARARAREQAEKPLYTPEASTQIMREAMGVAEAADREPVPAS